MRDVFLQRLMQSVYKWYEEWYYPAEAYHKNNSPQSIALEREKEFHKNRREETSYPCGRGN